MKAWINSCKCFRLWQDWRLQSLKISNACQWWDQPFLIKISCIFLKPLDCTYTEPYKNIQDKVSVLTLMSTLKRLLFTEAFWSHLMILRVCCKTLCFKMVFMPVKNSLVLIQISKGTIKMNEQESILSEAGMRFMSSEVIRAHFPSPSRTHR